MIYNNYSYEDSDLEYVDNQTYHSNESSLSTCKNGSFPSYLNITCQKSKKNFYRKLL